MKKTLLFLGASLLFLFSCGEQPKENKTDADAAATKTAQIERGAYLVTIAGCNDCHSPKRMGAQGPELIPELKLSGYPSSLPVPKFDSKMLKQGFSMFIPDLTATAGPWGIAFAGNLTPDETGIGNWTEAQFKKAMREGKFKGLDGGRMLLPPMPWQNYVNMKDEDVSAIFAYLKSLKPVSNLVPAPVVPIQ